jgi:hypothetical protein
MVSKGTVDKSEVLAVLAQIRPTVVEVARRPEAMTSDKFPFTLDGKSYHADRTFADTPAVYTVTGFDKDGWPYVDGLGASGNPVRADVLLLGLKTHSVVVIGQEDYTTGEPKA